MLSRMELASNPMFAQNNFDVPPSKPQSYLPKKSKKEYDTQMASVFAEIVEKTANGFVVYSE